LSCSVVFQARRDFHDQVFPSPSSVIRTPFPKSRRFLPSRTAEMQGGCSAERVPVRETYWTYTGIKWGGGMTSDATLTSATLTRRQLVISFITRAVKPQRITQTTQYGISAADESRMKGRNCACYIVALNPQSMRKESRGLRSRAKMKTRRINSTGRSPPNCELR